MTIPSARFRLTALWLAVLARSLGQFAALPYAIAHIGRDDTGRSIGILFLWLGISAIPAFSLAPLIGALASSRRRRPTMYAATLAGLGAIAWASIGNFPLGHPFWLVLIGVLAFESAFFSACRFALLPEGARWARTSLPQLIGVFAFAVLAGAFGGMWIYFDHFKRGFGPTIMPPIVDQPDFLAVFGIGGYALATFWLLFARLPIEKPTNFADGLMKPFLHTFQAIVRNNYGRNCLLALWGLFAIGLISVLMPPDLRLQFLLALTIGVVVGSLHGHPHRTLGIVPYASIGLAAAAIWAFAGNHWYAVMAMAVFSGAMITPLVTIYTIYQPDETRGFGGAILHAGWSVVVAVFLVVLFESWNDAALARSILRTTVLVLGLLSLVSWYAFSRSALEITVEAILAPMYRIEAIGPGVPLLPLKGPVLMIANHAAWFDPFWLAKIAPAPVLPMMTSKFYDLPVISWFARKIVHAIRVPDVPLRKEAPEIKEAVAALNHGDYVFIFPEGWLRRKQEQEMRRFARGVWHILRARPATVVFPCWIDGGWGSMISYKDGPPLKGKKWDVRRPINIAIGEPVVVSPEDLKTHMATRTLLMRAVLDARSMLGLPPFDAFSLHVHDDDGDKPPAKEGPA